MKLRASCAALLLALAMPAAAQTIDEIQMRANAGDRQSQFLLGEAYRTGQGLTPDRDQAINWFRRAAAQGDTRASDALGLLLFTKGDRKESIPLLEAAEARQDARAFYLLGTARFNGDGVTKDLPRAYAEMRAAADKGLPQAVRSLQLMDQYVSDQDRMASNAIHPGQTPPPTTVATAPPTPSSAMPSTTFRPAPPTPIQTVELPPSQPAAPMAPPPVPKPAPAAAPAPPASKPAIIASAKPAAPTQSVAPPTASTPTGKWRVQLGAIGTQEKAEEHWRELVKKLPQLNRLTHTVMQAGAIWRLQATGLASRAEAQEICTAVVAKGGVCIALNPAPTAP